MRRNSHLLLATVLAMLAFAPAASAASSSTIYQDAADGRIDGTYKLAELRRADSGVSAEQREYYGWDAVYADAIRRLADPKASGKAIVVVPIDSNRNGKIDPAEKAKAAAKQTKLREKDTVRTDGSDADQPKDEASERDSDELASSKGPDSDDGDGMSPLVWLLLLIPAAVIGFGVWRARKDRSKRPRATQGYDEL